MQKSVGLTDVADVPGRADHRVRKAGVGIDPDMRLHAEVPLIAFLALLHFLVPLTRFEVRVIGRGLVVLSRRIFCLGSFRPKGR